MTRKRVYLAGPISKGDLAHNIQQASNAFEALARAGFAPWCPHWSALSGPVKVTGGGSPYVIATAGGCGLSHNEWLAVDLAWVAKADAILRLPGESVGADREVEEAKRLGIPVFTSIADLKQWAAENEEVPGWKLDAIPNVGPVS